jgi:hypothetical protein
MHRWTGVVAVTVTGLVLPVVLGLVLGLLVRAVWIVRRAVPVFWTVLVGVGFAFLGSYLSGLFGLRSTAGIDWLDIGLQAVVVVVGEFLVTIVFLLVDGPPSRFPVPPTVRRPGEPLGTPEPTLRGAPRSIAEFESGIPQHAVGPPTRTRIFISYRRSDTGHAAARIVEALREQFGRAEVFFDIDTIQRGANFVDHIRSELEKSAVVLVVIGGSWLGSEARLLDPEDNVRLEIELALRYGCVVLPVLVDGAAMPRRDQLPESIAVLRQVNACSVDRDSWGRDVADLIADVTRLRGPAPGPRRPGTRLA